MNDTKESHTIMVVDDEKQFLFSVDLSLRGMGYKNVITISESHKVMPALVMQNVAVILLDLQMPGRSGIDLLKDIKFEFPHIPVIIVTATNEIEIAVECMKKGAIDFLVKPLDINRLFSSLKTALEINSLQYQVSSLKAKLLEEKLENEAAFSKIITRSPKMFSLFKYIEAIAASRDTVLITGETGTGKELIAESIHKSSQFTGKFVPVNLAGLDDTMFSDTLFGHTKGAYTGAGEERSGLVAQAEGGTLFLDEIGDLNENSQVKLLRLLEEGTYYSLGSDSVKTSKARIVVATNKNISKMIGENKFRKDLFYRLGFHQISVPALSERPEDIPLLFRHFLKQAALSYKKSVPAVPPEINILLSNYNYPGNVRELRGMVFNAVAMHKGGVLSMQSFKKVITTVKQIDKNPVNVKSSTPKVVFDDYKTLPTIKEIEAQLIDEALQRAQGNQSIAASFLGISRQALNKRLIRKQKTD